MKRIGVKMKATSQPRPEPQPRQKRPLGLKTPVKMLSLCFLASYMPTVMSNKPQLRISSDGPAILDSKISFKADLLYADNYRGPFYFRWSDDSSPGHSMEKGTPERSMNYSLSYSSKQYEEREYTMNVIVFNEVTFFRDEIASASIQYRITKQLNGQIDIFQEGAIGHNISSKANVQFGVNLHDPSGFLNNAVMQYFWFINDYSYGQTENSTFTYKFSSPGINLVEVIVLANVERDPDPLDHHNGFWRNASAMLRSATMLSRTDLNPPNPTIPPYVKSGVFRVTVESRTPIDTVNITGETWLKHGKLLRLNISCDGSGPYKFCWSLKQAPYNKTGNETCLNVKYIDSSPVCSFEIVWYFRMNGTFDIMTVVDNGISKRVEVIPVNIYQVHHPTPLSMVVVPICSCLIAVIAIGSGIFVWLAFKRNLAVETADFDFSSPDEQLEYKTFWERLRDSMVNAFSNASDDVSHISSVSSRSVAAPANIHYGSIR